MRGGVDGRRVSIRTFRYFRVDVRARVFVFTALRRFKKRRVFGVPVCRNHCHTVYGRADNQLRILRVFFIRGDISYR